MITFHADDYGINIPQSERILYCRHNGVLNSVSIMPNSRNIKDTITLIDNRCKIGIHINLAEGRCISKLKESTLLLGKRRKFFSSSFFQLLLLSLFEYDKIVKESSVEICSQIKRIMRFLPKDYKIRVDSHLHYHMIPAIFEGMCIALSKMDREVEYIRFPVESIVPYLKHPKAFLRIPPINMIKASVLKILGFFNRKTARKYGYSSQISGDFMGVLLTGRMDYTIVRIVLEELLHNCDYSQKNIEILFHPGGIRKGEELLDLNKKDLVKYYRSSKHELEAETLIRLKGKYETFYCD